MTIRRALVLATIVMTAAPARADDTVKLFPLSASKLPAELVNAPDRLTRALAAAIGAEVASVPIEVAAGLL